MTSVTQAGERIEELLASLRSRGGAAADTAEELVRLLVGMYGDGLAAIMAALAEETRPGRSSTGSPPTPSWRACCCCTGCIRWMWTRGSSVRSIRCGVLRLARGGVQYLGVTDGVARLLLEGSCHGCPSSTVTVRLAIEGAVQDAAPEVTEVVVEGMTAPPEPKLLQIGPRPSGVPGAGPPSGRGRR